jgi:hypothetical protein
MKTFKEISNRCPFCFTGKYYNSYVCVARLSIPNLKNVLYECQKSNCALWYFMNLDLMEKENYES